MSKLEEHGTPTGPIGRGMNEQGSQGISWIRNDPVKDHQLPILEALVLLDQDADTQWEACDTHGCCLRTPRSALLMRAESVDDNRRQGLNAVAVQAILMPALEVEDLAVCSDCTTPAEKQLTGAAVGGFASKQQNGLLVRRCRAVATGRIDQQIGNIGIDGFFGRMGAGR
ncbi:hypothetical protein D9M72_526420 [compost metagenome]